MISRRRASRAHRRQAQPHRPGADPVWHRPRPGHPAMAPRAGTHVRLGLGTDRGRPPLCSGASSARRAALPRRGPRCRATAGRRNWDLGGAHDRPVDRQRLSSPAQLHPPRTIWADLLGAVNRLPTRGGHGVALLARRSDRCGRRHPLRREVHPGSPRATQERTARWPVQAAVGALDRSPEKSKSTVASISPAQVAAVVARERCVEAPKSLPGRCGRTTLGRLVGEASTA